MRDAIHRRTDISRSRLSAHVSVIKRVPRIVDREKTEGGEGAVDSDLSFLLKLSTFRPTSPLSRRSGRLARISPYSAPAYERGAKALLPHESTMAMHQDLAELLSIEQLAFIATAYVSANHRRDTTTALLARVGDVISSRLNSRALALSKQAEVSNALMKNNLSDGGRSLELISSSSLISAFARVGLKHLPLFTAVSFLVQGAMRFKAIRPKSKAAMTWLAALLWSYSQVGLYDPWLWSEASLLLQGDPAKWFKLMDADDCLKLTWAMVRVRHDADPTLIHLLSDRASTQVGKLSMEDLGFAWAAIADISRRSKKPPSDRLLMALSKASRLKVNSIKPSTLSLIFTSIASLMETCPPSDDGFWKHDDGPPHSVSELLNDVAVWSSNKASNFKPEEILGTLVAMSSIGYHNRWALRGICRKLVMPRKLASSKSTQPPLIKILHPDQLIILIECLSKLEHYSSSLLSRILARFSTTDLPSSSLVKILTCLVTLRHHDAAFLDYAVKRLRSSNEQDLSEAVFLSAMIDNQGSVSTQLVLNSLTPPGAPCSRQEVQMKTFWARSLLLATKDSWDSSMNPSEMTSIAKLFDAYMDMDKRIAHIYASDAGRGASHLSLLLKDIERQLTKRPSGPIDAPSISCRTFHILDARLKLFADIAIPSARSDRRQGKGLVIILVTEQDLLRFWPGGESDPSSRPIMPLSLLRANMAGGLGWKVLTINWLEWIDAVTAKKGAPFL